MKSIQGARERANSAFRIQPSPPLLRPPTSRRFVNPEIPYGPGRCISNRPRLRDAHGLRACWRERDRRPGAVTLPLGNRIAPVLPVGRHLHAVAARVADDGCAAGSEAATAASL